MALNVTVPIPTFVRPANDSVLNVFAPVMVMPVAAALVKLTLLKVSPPPLNVDEALEQDIVDVPASKVKFVVVAIKSVADDDSVRELPFQETERTFELSEEKLPAVKA